MTAYRLSQMEANGFYKNNQTTRKKKYSLIYKKEISYVNFINLLSNYRAVGA